MFIFNVLYIVDTIAKLYAYVIKILSLSLSLPLSLSPFTPVQSRSRLSGSSDRVRLQVCTCLDSFKVGVVGRPRPFISTLQSAVPTATIQC